MKPWLTVIGVGEEGLSGLNPALRSLIDTAELLVGGDRHHSMVPATKARRLTWEAGIDSVIDEIEKWRGGRVVVLATGNPMWYGAGANLARRFTADDLSIFPHPGSFSLAASRMVWSIADVETLSVHGRPLASLALHIAPGLRLLVLSRDGDTPAETAKLLCGLGYGPSSITVFEHMGGDRERRFSGIAETWDHSRAADLNTMAIECRAGPNPRLVPRCPGLPDDLFENDGQLTKREVRAATISALAPFPGQVLWDVGAGSGSISIEWLRTVLPFHPAGRYRASAIAIESSEARCAVIARNAATFGVPQLRIVNGRAPEACANLPTPDTIFVGGGVSHEDLLDFCWQRLAPGGRLVANSVTVEANGRLIEFRSRRGGELVRMAISRTESVGQLSGFKPMMEVTQLIAVKS